MPKINKTELHGPMKPKNPENNNKNSSNNAKSELRSFEIGINKKIKLN